MAGLSNIFGNNDSDTNSSSNDANNSDQNADVSSALGLDISNSSENFSQDEDGNTDYSSNDTGIGLDTNTDALLDSVTSSMSGDDFSSDN